MYTLYLQQFSVSSVSSGQSGLMSHTWWYGIHVMLSEHKKCESVGQPLSVIPAKYSRKYKFCKIKKDNKRLIFLNYI